MNTVNIEDMSTVTEGKEVMSIVHEIIPCTDLGAQDILEEQTLNE